MRLQRFSWRWWLLLAGSPIAIVGAVGILLDGGKPWVVLMLIGLVAVLVGNPVWSGLRGLKDR